MTVANIVDLALDNCDFGRSAHFHQKLLADLADRFTDHDWRVQCYAGAIICFVCSVDTSASFRADDREREALAHYTRLARAALHKKKKQP